jgi:SAM-dependent methyltransferase
MRPTCVLSVPHAFDAFQRLVGAGASKRRFVENEVRAWAGGRVLDLGCGTGALLEYLPVGTHYVGVDVSPAYIRAARERHGSAGSFVCADVTTFRPPQDELFDVAMAYGFFHHLDDDQAEQAFAVARSALHPSGRMVAAEPCVTSERTVLESALMALDRGAFIRTPAEYASLAKSAFPDVRLRVLRGELRIPYTLALLEAAPAA